MSVSQNIARPLSEGIQEFLVRIASLPDTSSESQSNASRLIAANARAHVEDAIELLKAEPKRSATGDLGEADKIRFAMHSLTLALKELNSITPDR